MPRRSPSLHPTRQELGVALLLSLILLVLPNAAAAKPNATASSQTITSPPSVEVLSDHTSEFTLRSSNGYRITVSGEVGEHGPGAIGLSVERGDSIVEYSSARGEVTSTSMRGTFGHLGAVSLRFQPAGKLRLVKVPNKCYIRPKVAKAQLGTFLGTIRFRGEGGYTEVSADRAKGGIGDPLAIDEKLRCSNSNSHSETPHEPDVSLEASTLNGLGFSADANSPFVRHGIQFEASAFEKAGKMEIVREVWVIGPASDFLFDNTLTSATVTPPAPFTGSGAFQTDADGTTSWTGSLGVSLPGRGSVSLTGPGFKGELRRSGLF